MRFGEYIRSARQDRQWTQPEAAKQIGIEQSYLSKLESGKAFPSEDTFSQIVSTYGIVVEKMTDELFPEQLDRLREIKQIRASILHRKNGFRKAIQVWFVAGVSMLMLSGAAFGTAWLGQDRIVEKYLYKSDINALAAGTADAETSVSESPERLLETPPNRELEITEHGGEAYQAIEDYRGVVFFETIADGRRVWRFYGSSEELVRSPLRWFLIPGTMLLMGALGCFIAGFRARSSAK